MRNVFDQYSQPENRVTHALACTLAADSTLLRDFLKRVVGVKPPAKAVLEVVEQRLPGDPEPVEEEPGRRGLPDMVIHDGEAWAVAFEAKVAAKLTRGQIERHRKTLAKRGFNSISMVALDVVEHTGKTWPDVRFVQWTDVYVWAKSKLSEWAAALAAFLEITESKLIQSGYLKEGALTTFTGIPFGPESPYNYGEAKRLLRHAMQEVRKDTRLAKVLGADLRAGGRSAITGKATHRVWDYIPLKVAREAGQHTHFPHLSLDISSVETRAYVSVPNGVKAGIRNRLLDGGWDAFSQLVELVVAEMAKRFGAVDGAAPYCEVSQRRYPTQSAKPLMDADLRFDPRTAFAHELWPTKRKIHHQGQWLRATYESLANKRSNLHFSIGMAFEHARCDAVSKPNAVRLFADGWLSCEPLTDRLVSA